MGYKLQHGRLQSSWCNWPTAVRQHPHIVYISTHLLSQDGPLVCKGGSGSQTPEVTLTGWTQSRPDWLVNAPEVSVNHPVVFLFMPRAKQCITGAGETEAAGKGNLSPQKTRQEILLPMINQ